MRAMLLHEPGGSVTFAEVKEPGVGPTDAKVRVRAAGVGLTIIIMKGTPGLVTSFPRILGHEIAGDVVEVGREVRNVKVGDRVVCHFYLTCGGCKFCRSGRETLCENWRGYVGMACDGGYAEYMSVPACNLCHLPEAIPYAEGSIISDAIATPLHACRTEAKVGPGDEVLVIGAGGLLLLPCLLGYLFGLPAPGAAGSFLAWMGERTYSVYLWQQPLTICYFLPSLFHPLGAVLSIFVGACWFRWFERPFLSPNRSHRLAALRPAPK